MLGDAGKRVAHDLASHASPLLPSDQQRTGRRGPPSPILLQASVRQPRCPRPLLRSAGRAEDSVKACLSGRHHGIVLSLAGVLRRFGVDMPKGVRDGQVLRLAACACRGSDLYLRIELLPHALQLRAGAGAMGGRLRREPNRTDAGRHAAAVGVGQGREGQSTAPAGSGSARRCWCCHRPPRHRRARPMGRWRVPATASTSARCCSRPDWHPVRCADEQITGRVRQRIEA